MNTLNKVAIVTGASMGIGEATAKLISEKGAKVALVARSKDKLDQLSQNLPSSIAIQADMTKIDDIKNMVKKTEQHFGRIDILVNNAGQGYDAPIEKTDVNTVHHIFNLNVIGPLVAMQHVIPIIRKQGGGAIVNISSGLALMYLPNMSVYSSSKRALANISLTAKEELKNDNITVSVMYPFITLTDFEKNTIKAAQTQDWQQEDGESPLPTDTAEYVAQKILEAIETGKAEVFAHDWMKKMTNEET
jgi:short-subunit dehydrogenase